MNLDIHDLHKILTSESLLAADHLSKLLDTENAQDYDALFSIVFERLESLITEDHPIDVEVRAQLFRGISERTPLDSHLKTKLANSYIEFIQTHSSEPLKSFITNRSTTAGLDSVSCDTPLSFFYGPWVPEMPLKEALEYIENPLRSAFGTLRHDIARRPTVQQQRAYAKMSVDEKCKHILKLDDEEYRNMDRFKFAVGHLKNHPKFNELLNYVLSEADYANSTLINHPLLNFDNYLTVSQQPLTELKTELVDLNTQFQTKKIAMMGDPWVSNIVERCKKLLHSMAHNNVVAVSKSSIEQFRAKDTPTDHTKEDNLTLTQRI